MSEPELFFNGFYYSDSFITESLSVDVDYVFICEVLYAFPAPNIRWLKNGNIDVSEGATTQNVLWRQVRYTEFYFIMILPVSFKYLLMSIFVHIRNNLGSIQNV